MIKLRIVNYFQDFTEEMLAEAKENAEDGFYICHAINPYNLKSYDEEKYKDGKVYEFDTLKDLNAFYKQAIDDIDYKQDYAETFSTWSWQEVDHELEISDEEDNLMILSISAHDEWRD